MSRLSIVLIAVLLSFALATLMSAGQANALDFLWQSWSGEPGVREYGRGISVDETGVYVVGKTEDNWNGFLSKLDDSDGEVVWTLQIGNSGNMYYAEGVSVYDGAIYVAGYADGMPGSLGGLVWKFDLAHNLIWTKQLSTTGADYAYGIYVDVSGVYVTGKTSGTFPGQTSAGGYDAFVCKLDHSDGGLLWVTQFGTSGFDGIDNSGQSGSNTILVDGPAVYVVGRTNGTFPDQPPNPGGDDAFVCELDASDGAVQWTVQFGSSSSDRASGISVCSGYLYVSGFTWGELPGQTHGGGADAFVCKLDENGGIETIDQFGIDGQERAHGVCTDGSLIYVAGYSDTDLAKEPLGPFPDWNEHAFIRCYDLNLTVDWTQMFSPGSPYSDRFEAVACHSAAVYGAGYTAGPTTPPDGWYDALVIKLGSPNSPPTVYIESEVYDVNEGSSVPVTAVGSDPDEDPLSYAWDLDEDGEYDDGSGDEVSYSGVDGPSTHTIAVKVTDTGGLFATDAATVNVLNVAPTVDQITAPYDPVPVDAPVTATASFSDPGILDTHDGEQTFWDWGDETAPEEGIVAETNGSGSVTGYYTYVSAGVYTVTLTVTDDDGASGESFFQYVVVYDPAAGFVTGGGWIWSPGGAYIQDPLLEGKANFGFVSKYRKGATIPIGNTEFAFKVADLNFHSTEYQWLVIAGPKAMFKGSGEINGEGDYDFMVTAWDGDAENGGGVDEFRIKIWDAVTEQVVYDCEQLPLGGGSIVIHTGGGGQSLRSLHARPTVFALQQNHPNPFHGSTTIEYSLPADRDVSLRIYDSAGRLVRTLVDEHQASGFYGAEWDGHDALGVEATNGIYLMRLVAGDFTSTKKMILIR